MSRRKPILQINKISSKKQKTFGGRSNRFENVVDYSGNHQGVYNTAAAKSPSVDAKVAHFMKEIDSSKPEDGIEADAKVADFLKEIDGMELPTESSSKQSKVKKNGKSVIDFGPWKECIDEQTQHPYYWNTLTNEVTWTLPPDLVAQYASLEANSPTVDGQSNDASVPKSDQDGVEIKPIKKPKSSKKKTASSSAKTGLHDLEKTNNIIMNDQSKPDFSRASPEQDGVLGRANGHSEAQEFIQEDMADSLNSLSCHTSPDSTTAAPAAVEKKAYLSKKTQTSSVVLCNQEVQVDVPVVQKKMHTKAVNTSCDEKIKQKINTLSAILASKLTFLEISNTNLSDFQILLLEMDVRMRDWKAGQLSDDYVLESLEAAKEKLKTYEANAVPSGWSCQWNMQYERYYYRNNLTNQSQWQYPQSIDNKYPHQAVLNDPSSHPGSPVGNTATIVKETPKNISDGKKKNKTSSSETIVISDSSTSLVHNNNNMLSHEPGSYGFSNDPPPPPPGEEIPPPLPSTPEDKPPLPPSPSGSIPPPIPPPPMLVAYTGFDSDSDEDNNKDDDSTNSNQYDGVEMDISDAEESTHSNESSAAVFSRSNEPELYTTPVAYQNETMTYHHHQSQPVIAQAPIIRSAPVVFSSEPKYVDNTASSYENVGSKRKVPSHQHHQKEEALLYKKSKRVKKNTVTKKPPKEMFGMVAKWQKAKQQIEDEEKRLIRESEEQLDFENDSQKKIEKWKQDQYLSGKAAYNANFEPVSNDWKKRVKAKRQQNIS